MYNTVYFAHAIHRHARKYRCMRTVISFKARCQKDCAKILSLSADAPASLAVANYNAIKIKTL